MLWDKAAQETTAVEARINDELRKWPLIHFLIRHFGSLLFGASQKLIDRAVKTGESRPRDEAIVATCARLFSEAYSAYELLRKGLILQSIVLLRSTFEISTQGILFLDDEEQAKEWLGGKRIRPHSVRELTSMPSSQRRLYQKLANLAHPNRDALSYLSVPVRRGGKPGIAYVYGGWFAPKEAGQIAIQLLWAQLVFLEKFYGTYSADLEEHGLLWVPAVTTLPESDDRLSDFTWDRFLSIWRDVLTELTKEHGAKSPADIIEIALAMSDYTPEEKEQWRRGFEDAERDGDIWRGQEGL